MKFSTFAAATISTVILATGTLIGQPTAAHADGGYDDPAAGLRVRFTEITGTGPSKFYAMAVADDQYAKIYLDRAESMDLAAQGQWQPWVGMVEKANFPDHPDTGYQSQHVERTDLSDIWRACVGIYGEAAKVWRYDCSHWVHGLPYRPGG